MDADIEQQKRAVRNLHQPSVASDVHLIIYVLFFAGCASLFTYLSLNMPGDSTGRSMQILAVAYGLCAFVLAVAAAVLRYRFRRNSYFEMMHELRLIDEAAAARAHANLAVHMHAPQTDHADVYYTEEPPNNPREIPAFMPNSQRLPGSLSDVGLVS